MSSTHLVLLFLSSALLASCTSTSETFDCPAGKGVGCQSISTVNEKVNEGTLGNSPKKEAPVLLTPKDEESVDGETPIYLSDDTVVHRVREKALRVWMAPFQDEQGNLHEASFIHTILKPGRWQLQESL